MLYTHVELHYRIIHGNIVYTVYSIFLFILFLIIFILMQWKDKVEIYNVVVVDLNKLLVFYIGSLESETLLMDLWFWFP